MKKLIGLAAFVAVLSTAITIMGPPSFVVAANGPPPQPFGPAPIIAMWKDCDGTNYLRSDGFCAAPDSGGLSSVGLTMPTGFSVANSPLIADGTLAVTTTLSGLLRGTGSGFATSTSANVISLWSGTCDATSYLRGDGACTTPTAGAPTNATYITQTANGTLSNEQALGALGTGILKSTTTTGVVSIAASPDVISLWSGTCNSGTYLRADGSCQTPASGSPGGATTQIQFNNAGAFAGDADFVWNSTSNILTLGATNSQIVLGNTAGNGLLNGPTASGGNNGGDLVVAGGIGGSGGARGGNLTVSGGAAASGGEQGALTLSSGTGGTTAGDVNVATNGSVRITFAGDGSWDMAGTTPGTSGQVLTSTGATTAPTWQTVSAGVAQTTGNFTASFTDACSTTPTQVVNWVLTGSVVTLRITQNIGACTSDSTSFATAAGDLPLALRPAANITAQGFLCADVGTNLACGLRVETDGTIRYCVSASTNACSAANWTNSGNKLMTMTNAQSVLTYNLN